MSDVNTIDQLTQQHAADVAMGNSNASTHMQGNAVSSTATSNTPSNTSGTAPDSPFHMSVPLTHTPMLFDASGGSVVMEQGPSMYTSAPALSSLSSPANVSQSPSLYTQTPAPGPIVMRALIITSDASVIIGKQGRHINEIRELSGARLNISESIPSNPERILTVSGALDAVSKAFGLLVRRINDEPFDQPSLPGARAASFRFIIPNSHMGAIIGRQGSKIKEIQEASGARLHAGETMLPGSTERILNITGVADALHIAVYYVGATLLEHPDRGANNLPYRPAAMNRALGASLMGSPIGTASPNSSMLSAGGSPKVLGSVLTPGFQTQQIFIPNDLVGCIIGKGGQKINEIRQLSASHIKIMERNAGIAAGGSGTERLVTITGPPPNIQMAVTLLYQRLEQEKLRLAQNTPIL